MAPLAALAASERASGRSRQRRLRLLQFAAQIEASLIRGVCLWRNLSLTFDVVCIGALAVWPMTPEPLATLNGCSMLPIPPLWARYMQWLGRLAFNGR
jgi:hypothetical protein